MTAGSSHLQEQVACNHGLDRAPQSLGYIIVPVELQVAALINVIIASLLPVSLIQSVKVKCAILISSKSDLFCVSCTKVLDGVLNILLGVCQTMLFKCASNQSFKTY